METLSGGTVRSFGSHGNSPVFLAGRLRFQTQINCFAVWMAGQVALAGVSEAKSSVWRGDTDFKL